MKKTIICIAVALLLILSLAACGDSGSSGSADSDPQPTVLSDDNSDAPVTEADTVEAKEINLSHVMDLLSQRFDFGEMREIDDSERYYSISASDVKQFAAIISAQSKSYNEIILCEAADSAAVQQIETMLNRRLDVKLNTAKSYDKDEYAMVEQCAVKTSGRIVYLVIAPDAAAVCDYLEGLFR